MCGEDFKSGEFASDNLEFWELILPPSTLVFNIA